MPRLSGREERWPEHGPADIEARLRSEHHAGAAAQSRPERTSEARTIAGLQFKLNPSGSGNRPLLAIFQVRQQILLQFYDSDA
jgi:hypothetical protein